MGDTVDTIAGLMGAKVEVHTDEVRLRPEKSEVERLWADTTKAKRLTGWEPAYGGLEGFRRGLAETIAWFGDARNLEAYKHDRYNV